jgi:hypothetical protein
MAPEWAGENVGMVSAVVVDAFADFGGERTLSVVVVGRNRKELRVVRFEIRHGISRDLLPDDCKWRVEVGIGFIRGSDVNFITCQIWLFVCVPGERGRSL